MGSRLAGLTVMCVLVVVAAGCGGGSTPAGSSSESARSSTVPVASGALVDDATFRFSLASDPGVLDHATNVQPALEGLMSFAYDGLVATLDGNDVVPNLASKWAIEPGTVTFTVRKGVTCSDGSPVTPETIARSFEFYKSPTVQYPLFGDVADWRVGGDDAKGTVTFTFGEPVGFPVESLADIPVVCGKGLEDRTVLERQTSGSGPYVLSKVVPNERYVLTRREGYGWGPDGVTSDERGLPETVELRVVQDPSTTVNLLLAGDLDGAELTGSGSERLDDGARVLAKPATVLQNIFNHGEGHATSDPAVRRALMTGIDREGLATVTKGKVENNLLPPFFNPCPDRANGGAIPQYDPAAAGKLLDEAGWKAGPDGVRTKAGRPLVIDAPWHSAGLVPAEWDAAFELTATAWRALGIEVKTRTLSDPALTQALISGDWDVMALNSIQPPLPSQFTSLLSGPAPPDGTNFGRVDNPAYDRAAEQALAITNPEDVCDGWLAAERALYEEVDIVPVVAQDRLYAMGPSVDYGVSGYGVVPTSIRMHGG